MRSIFAKILLWAVGTVILSAAGFVLTTWWLSATHPPPVDLLGRLQAFQLEGAREAIERGGPESLARYLRRLDAIFEAEHHLVDARGIDLLDGRDRSRDLSAAGTWPGPPRPHGGRALVASPPRGDGPRLLVAIRPRFRPGEFLPYYLWILPVVVGVGYALSAHLARPLRGLRRAVERFGRGDLAARIPSRRRDEIGELARAFNAMADRIEVLLVAQRRLLQDVSHELKSPLTRLALAIRLARTSDDRAAALDRIKRESDRLAELVQELLQLSSAEGDPRACAVDEVRVDELLGDLAGDCAVEAEAKGCRLDLRCEGRDAVRGDSGLLRRACENVLRNAIRHAPEGTAVTITARRDGGSLVIEMCDRGPGVPPGTERSIFEPFFRVDGDRSRDGGGAGLGLAIARRAIALHHGEVTAENGHPGLIVSIRLPAP